MSDERELTREELVAICNKQREQIKELEKKLKTPSDTEKLQVAEPDYEELRRQVDDLNYMINENDALRWSLTTAYKEMNDWKNRSDLWEENYYKEHERAEKLFDELERKNNEKETNEIKTR